LHNSLLHLLLKICDFLNTDISQGSVATRLGCGTVFKYDSYKFPTESHSERILKIVFNMWRSYGQEYSVVFFLTHNVVFLNYTINLHVK